MTVNTTSGKATGVATFNLPSTSDNSQAPVSSSCNPSSPATLTIGSTTVSCTGTDTSGNSASCQFKVTVKDVEPPQLSCSDRTGVTAMGSATGAPTDSAAPAAQDNSGAAPTVVCTPALSSNFVIGSTTSTCTATDGAGNSASCGIKVTIRDTEAPKVQCPASPITNNTVAGTARGVALWSTPSATDNSGSTGTVVCSPSSGSSFAFGSTTVQCNSTDASNNVGSCTFTVQILDKEAPTITCPSNNVLTTSLNKATAPAAYASPVTFDAVDSNVVVDCSVKVGDLLSLGQTSISCAARDASANTASCGFTLTVVDQQPPSVTCPNTISSTTDFRRAYATVSWPKPSASDNSGLPVTVSSSPASNSSFAIGTTTVTVLARDAAGNNASCDFNVIVRDNEAPVFTGCPSDFLVNNTFGQASGLAEWTPAEAEDNSGLIPQVTCNAQSGGVFPLGPTRVTCNARDAAGNVAEPCAFTITVEDIEDPIITCPEDVVAKNRADVGVLTALVNYTLATARDNSGNATVFCDPASPAVLPIGAQIITCTATDSAGNNDTCSFEALVVDVSAPKLQCGPDVQVVLDQGQATAKVQYTAATAVDRNNKPLSAQCLPAAGSDFGVGATSVVCEATDDQPKTGACVLLVTVIDQEAPMLLNCSQGQLTFGTVPGQAFGAAVWPPVSAVDNADANVKVSCNAESGLLLDVNEEATISCNATDASGNQAQCSWSVTVTDQEAPRLVCPSSFSLLADLGKATAILQQDLPEVVDNVNVTSVSCQPAKGQQLQANQKHTVVCTAADVAGNQGQCSYNVTVLDTQKPTFPQGCPADQQVDAVVGTRTATVTFGLPAAVDNVQVADVVCRPASGSGFSVGASTVECTARDAAQNTEICSFQVNVRDSTPPVVQCPANITVPTSDPAGTQALVAYAAATASDDSGQPPVVQYSIPTGSVFSLGDTVVTVQATDAAGNVGTCRFMIRVLDVTPPVPTCPLTTLSYTTQPGKATGLAAYSLAQITATDNSKQTVQISCDPAPNSALTIGTHTVRCSAQDAAGNAADCRFTVSIADQEAPVLACSPVQKTVAFGLTGGAVKWQAVQASDNSGVSPTVACDPASGSVFALGNSTVNCAATDGSGNQGQCSFVVRVDEGEVNCVGEWSSWSSCSLCPQRKQTRRFIVEEIPSANGRQCPGPESTRDCPNAPGCNVIEASMELSPVDGSQFSANQALLESAIEQALAELLSENNIETDDEQVVVTSISIKESNNRRRDGTDTLVVRFEINVEDGLDGETLKLLNRLANGDTLLLNELLTLVRAFDSSGLLAQVSQSQHSRATQKSTGGGAGGGTSASKGGSGGSTGMIAGIVGAVAGLVILAAVIVVIVMRRRAGRVSSSSSKSRQLGGVVNPVYFNPHGNDDLDENGLDMGMFSTSAAATGGYDNEPRGFDGEEGLYAEPDVAGDYARPSEDVEGFGDEMGYLDVAPAGEEEVLGFAQAAEDGDGGAAAAQRKVQQLEAEVRRENAELRSRLDNLASMISKQRNDDE